MAGPRVEEGVAIVTGAGAVDPEGIGNGRAAAILFAREEQRCCSSIASPSSRSAPSR